MIRVLCFPLHYLIPVPHQLDNLLDQILQFTGLEVQLEAVFPHSPPLSHPLCSKFTPLLPLFLLLLKDQDKFLLKNCSMNLLTRFRMFRNLSLNQNRTFSANLFLQSAATQTTTSQMQHLLCILQPLLSPRPLKTD